MPKPIVWIVVIAVGITGYVLGTRAEAGKNLAKNAKKAVKSHR